MTEEVSTIIKKEKRMKGKRVFAQYVRRVLKLKKWKLTILLLGMKGGRLMQKIVRCYAKKIIGENLVYRQNL